MEEKKSIRKIKLNTTIVPDINTTAYNTTTYCYECGRMMPYSCHLRKRTRNFQGKSFTYDEEYALCSECNNEVTVPGMMEANEKEFARISRGECEIITIDEIYGMMGKYNIGKRPLSKVLGLGEITITRYLEGQIPSVKNSRLLLSAYRDYSVMEHYLEQNMDKISEKTYLKTKNAIECIKEKATYHSKIQAAAAYVIHSKYEVTDMSLQKILYYIKAFAKLLLNINIFEEQCEAWVHGPVYEKIYNQYKSYGREIIMEEKDTNIQTNSLLSAEEKSVIDYVLRNFAIYNGTVLREFTHKERPWIEARGNLGENERSRKIITDEMIFSYFVQMNHLYKITTEAGLKQYINSLHVL